MCNLNKHKCEGKCKKQHNIFKSEEVVNLVDYVMGKHFCEHKCGGCHHNHNDLAGVVVISEDMIK